MIYMAGRALSAGLFHGFMWGSQRGSIVGVRVGEQAAMGFREDAWKATGNE